MESLDRIVLNLGDRQRINLLTRGRKIQFQAKDARKSKEFRVRVEIAQGTIKDEPCLGYIN